MTFASGKQVNLACGELKVNNNNTKSSLVWNQLTSYLIPFWSMWCPEISLSKTWHMCPVLLIASRLLSGSTAMIDFQPYFPGQDLNTGQCNKLHRSQQGSNVYILIVNKFVFLHYCSTHSCRSYLDCIWQCNMFYLLLYS